MQYAAMTTIKRIASARFRHSEDGQDLLEYGMLAALIALIALGAVTMVGNTIHAVFWNAIAAAF